MTPGTKQSAASAAAAVAGAAAAAVSMPTGTKAAAAARKGFHPLSVDKDDAVYSQVVKDVCIVTHKLTTSALDAYWEFGDIVKTYVDQQAKRNVSQVVEKIAGDIACASKNRFNRDETDVSADTLRKSLKLREAFTPEQFERAKTEGLSIRNLLPLAASHVGEDGRDKYLDAIEAGELRQSDLSSRIESDYPKDERGERRGNTEDSGGDSSDAAGGGGDTPPAPTAGTGDDEEEPTTYIPPNGKGKAGGLVEMQTFGKSLDGVVGFLGDRFTDSLVEVMNSDDDDAKAEFYEAVTENIQRLEALAYKWNTVCMVALRSYPELLAEVPALGGTNEAS